MDGALAFACGLAVADLLLIMLLARRVRRLGEQTRAGMPRRWLRPGARIGHFETVTVDGERLSLDQLRGRRTLVGIFSTGCTSCRELLPAFARRAVSLGGPGSAYAVIVGPHSGATDYLDSLAGKATLVREAHNGPVTSAFAVSVYPGLYVLDTDGVVLASGASVAAISAAISGGPVGHGTGR